MASKAERTTQFILETVAPVFNKNGYVGTSLSHITEATGLTKGAVYGNFESKEHLAIEAFNYNVRRIVGLIAENTEKETSASAKLQAVTDFYRQYYDFTVSFGGCPILNVGVDSNHLNPMLRQRVSSVIEKLKLRITEILDLGIEQGEFKADLEVGTYALRIFSIIEGSVFTTVMLNDGSHLLDMMDHLDQMIAKEIKIPKT